MLGLLNSENESERGELKIIIHRLYARFILRKYLRKAIEDKLLEVIYEDDTYNRTDELLNIMVALISGYGVPLTNERVLFFKNVLVPLFKVRTMTSFNDGLLRCVMVYLDKDRTLAVCLIDGLLRYWPFANSEKEMAFLGVLKEVL